MKELILDCQASGTVRISRDNCWLMLSLASPSKKVLAWLFSDIFGGFDLASPI